MLTINVSIATTVSTLILLTSISGGRFEPPTVFMQYALISIVTYLSGFVKCRRSFLGAAVFAPER